MIAKTTVAMLLLVALVSPGSWADDAVQLPQTVTRPIQNAKDAIEGLRRTYRENAKAEAEKAVFALNKALNAASKAGNLDLVLAIKAKMSAVQDGMLLDEVDRKDDELPGLLFITPAKAHAQYGDPPAVPQDAHVTWSGSVTGPERAIDGKLDTSSIFENGKGSITVNYPSTISATTLIIYGRGKGAGEDTILLGRVVINGWAAIPFTNFRQGMVLALDLSHFKSISSIQIESLEGLNQPGIKEICLYQ